MQSDGHVNEFIDSVFGHSNIWYRFLLSPSELTRRPFMLGMNEIIFVFIKKIMCPKCWLQVINPGCFWIEFCEEDVLCPIGLPGLIKFQNYYALPCNCFDPQDADFSRRSRHWRSTNSACSSRKLGVGFTKDFICSDQRDWEVVARTGVPLDKPISRISLLSVMNVFPAIYI